VISRYLACICRCFDQYHLTPTSAIQKASPVLKATFIPFTKSLHGFRAGPLVPMLQNLPPLGARPNPMSGYGIYSLPMHMVAAMYAL
jgi:hypothetical protein